MEEHSTPPHQQYSLPPPQQVQPSHQAAVLSTTNRTYANSLIGKEVSFLTEMETGDFKETLGVVKKVYNTPDGGSSLIVESQGSEYTLGLNGVISVNN